MSSTPPVPDELQELRRKIDAIDEEILNLVAERRSCSQRVGEVKKHHQIATLRDATREYEIVTRLSREGLARGIPPTLTQSIFGALITDSLRRQEQDILRAAAPEGSGAQRRVGSFTRDGIWGEQAAASCAALHEEFGKKSGTSIRSWGSLAEALEALEAGRADLLMLPIEHSTLGTLRESVIALTDSPLRAIRDIRIPLSLTLMAPAGVQLNNIRRVYGSELTFRLCSSLLDTLAPVSPEIAPTLDPDWLASDGLKTHDWAFIAPEHVAITSGLTVLATSISDTPSTTLRFFACSLNPEPINPQLSYATSLIAASEQQSGALSRMLEIFRRHNIVLTKLESLGPDFAEHQRLRQLRSDNTHPFHRAGRTPSLTAAESSSPLPGAEFFLIECLGAESLPPLSTALAELIAGGCSPQIIGSYPRVSTPPEAGVLVPIHPRV